MGNNLNLVTMVAMVLNMVAIWVMMSNLVAMVATNFNLVAMEARPAMMEKSMARQMKTGCQEEMSVCSRILLQW